MRYRQGVSGGYDDPGTQVGAASAPPEGQASLLPCAGQFVAYRASAITTGHRKWSSWLARIMPMAAGIVRW